MVVANRGSAEVSRSRRRARGGIAHVNGAQWRTDQAGQRAGRSTEAMGQLTEAPGGLTDTAGELLETVEEQWVLWAVVHYGIQEGRECQSTRSLYLYKLLKFSPLLLV